ncbi:MULTISPECIES: histidine phosphatase family protein [unclassified Ruegeria]|uniref:histidine phosphatase family protein n=1 Tax=unclassified Ruegeria TaxID=2625375 RepID=UPI0014890D59|nr:MULTISPECIES: histidine phosphatase family protein [unclassified Ruegeria]NOD77238.1 histidine phosphatase family protein [Ruegeria sp. HKCCD4332]NOD89709.1 histidine phosphatase family protein [Ruegeria sp. HKCCD4318]NOE14032.1 histidine phosphatase family protein [Ruegeria sp. HKCCD4318-2]NOG08031.1 histidine phosphatase family protein [Ruegeria sp. HKCCD4315]
MTKLALLRHGHTHWNRAGQIQGRSDIPLDDDARTELAGYRLPDNWAQADIWSSPLQRAHETAQIVSGRIPQTSGALTEMNWGDWEGQRGVDLIADTTSGYKHIEDWGWDFRPPNGESPADVRDRLRPWLSALQNDAVAVCHIGIMRVILAQAWGWNFVGPAPFKIKRNRLYIVDVNTMTADPDPIRLPKRETLP